MKLVRDEGVLETDAQGDRPEIRLHLVHLPEGTAIVRVPWYKHTQGHWFDGVPGPPIKLSAIMCLRPFSQIRVAVLGEVAAALEKEADDEKGLGSLDSIAYSIALQQAAKFVRSLR